MSNTRNVSVQKCVRKALGAAVVLTLLGLPAHSFADSPVSMAPPNQDGITQDIDGGSPADASQNSVFQWTEVPQDQKIPLTRAVFDRNGYQLYDTAGETILVPFADNNLYVMKFAPSDDGTLYLVNQGDVPVLYVPQGGYLENASVPGSRWYPFSGDFHPAHPVFLGVAPSWNAFLSIGWSPDLVIRGGYWGRTSFLSGGIFLPSVGLVFNLGGHPYHGWQPYRDYVVEHPDHFHIGYADRSYQPHVFRGIGGGDAHAWDNRGGDAHAWDNRGGDAHAWDNRGGDAGHGSQSYRPADRSAQSHRVFRGTHGGYHHDSGDNRDSGSLGDRH